MTTTVQPTLADFILFIRNSMRIPAEVLPTESPWINWMYQEALLIVNRQLATVTAPRGVWTIYSRAVYNLGGHLMIVNAPDVEDAPDVVGSDPPLPYFANARKTWNINGFTAGAVQSSSDESTSVTLVVPKAFENLTFADLELMTTPWGRAYLAIAQKAGHSIWGLTT